LIRTWTLAACNLPESSAELDTWQSAFQRLGLTGAGFEERITALDNFLDLVEEILDNWALENGA
jgi:hypothetical protein